MRVSISYQSDIDRARAVLLELVKQRPSAREHVAYRASALASSSVNLSLLVWCANAGTAALLKAESLESIKKRFAAEDIEIPYLWTTVILKTPPASNAHPHGGTS